MSFTIEQLGLFLNLVGTIVLASGLIKSNKRIKQESATYYSRNMFSAQSMKLSRFLTILGLLIIALGFLIQIVYPNNNCL